MLIENPRAALRFRPYRREVLGGLLSITVPAGDGRALE
jgi:hypothetical protein